MRTEAVPFRSSDRPLSIVFASRFETRVPGYHTWERCGNPPSFLTTKASEGYSLPHERKVSEQGAGPGTPAVCSSVLRCSAGRTSRPVTRYQASSGFRSKTVTRQIGPNSCSCRGVPAPVARTGFASIWFHAIISSPNATTRQADPDERRKSCEQAQLSENYGVHSIRSACRWRAFAKAQLHHHSRPTILATATSAATATPPLKRQTSTPLAKGGLLFGDFHSNGAVCSPTRASLLTGRYPQRCGLDGVFLAKGSPAHRHGPRRSNPRRSPRQGRLPDRHFRKMAPRLSCQVQPATPRIRRIRRLCERQRRLPFPPRPGRLRRLVARDQKDPRERLQH